MDIISRLNRVLSEGVEERVPKLLPALLSKKSKWEHKDKGEEYAAEFIRGIAQYDPTGDRGTYLRYIIAQLRMGKNNLDLPNDGMRLLDTLTWYDNTKNTMLARDIKLPNDINRITSWRNLEDLKEKHNEKPAESKRQLSKRHARGITKIASVVLPNDYSTEYTLYKVTEPEACVIVGRGTRWCTGSVTPNNNPPEYTYPQWHDKAGQTRQLEYMEAGAYKGYPTTAINYLRQGPLYVMTIKNYGNMDPSMVGSGGQYLQMTKSGNEIMNVRDEPISRTGPGLTYAAEKFLEMNNQDIPDKAMEAIIAKRKFRKR